MMPVSIHRLVRRWTKPVGYAAALAAAGWCGWILYRDIGLDERVHAWATLAIEKNLIFRDQTVCVLPGLEENPIGRVLAGRREVLVAAFHPEDIDALLTLPECPVRLVIVAGSTLYLDDVKRLRNRFGDSVH